MHKSYYKKWRKLNPNYHKEWNLKHPNYYKYRKIRLGIYHPRILKSIEELDKNTLSVRRWRLKYPQRNKAHRIVSVNIRNGKLKKLACIKCGNLKSQAHHEDYSKPLEIIWLCKKHHVEADKLRSKLCG